MASVYRNESDESITVSYPTREAQQNISKADYYAARCLGEVNKVRAIKFVRMQTGLGLYESRQIVDTILAHRDVLAETAPATEAAQPSSLGALLRAKVEPSVWDQL